MTLTPLLACGRYFDEAGAIASLTLVLIVKPLAYIAYIKGFRYRVSRPIPMTHKQAAGMAAVRTLLGVVFIGGGAIALAYIGRSGEFIIASGWPIRPLGSLGSVRHQG